MVGCPDFASFFLKNDCEIVDPRRRIRFFVKQKIVRPSGHGSENFVHCIFIRHRQKK